MIDCAMCGRWTDDPGEVCAWCLDCSARDVAALVLDWRDLCEVLPAAGALEARVSGTHTPGIPIDLGADEVARDIAWTLGVWEPPVREAVGMGPAPETKIRPGRLVTRAAAVLSSHMSDFVSLGDTWGYPDGLEGGCVARSGLYGVLSCRRLHGRALSVLGLTRPVTRLPGMCGRCGAAALSRQAGSDSVDCGHCGQSIGDDEYQAYVGMTLGNIHHPIG